jgi:PadR family transcriptional regulator, regulatory protein PadR
LDMLTKLEELVLIAVLKLKEEAYGIPIYKYIVELTGNEVAVSSVYFPLERLTRRGLLNTYTGSPTAKRGGMRKTYYRVTKKGLVALEENRALIDRAWKGIPSLMAGLNKV